MLLREKRSKHTDENHFLISDLFFFRTNLIQFHALVSKVKYVFLKENKVLLLCHRPGDKVSWSPLPSRQALHNALLGYLPLQTDLNNTQHLGQNAGVWVCGAKQTKQVVSGCIGHHLQVVGSVFVMRRDVERHDPLEKGLGGFVIAEKGVSVDIVQVAVLTGGAAWRQGLDKGGVQAKQPV